MNDLCMLILVVSHPYAIFNARIVSTIYFIASDLKIFEYFHFHMPSNSNVILNCLNNSLLRWYNEGITDAMKMLHKYD